MPHGLTLSGRYPALGAAAAHLAPGAPGSINRLRFYLPPFVRRRSHELPFTYWQHAAYMPHFPAGRYDTWLRRRLSAFFVEPCFDYAVDHLLADYCELAVCQRGTFDNGGLYLRCIFFLLLPIRLWEYAQPFGILDARYFRVGLAR